MSKILNQISGGRYSKKSGQEHSDVKGYGLLRDVQLVLHMYMHTFTNDVSHPQGPNQRQELISSC